MIYRIESLHNISVDDIDINLMCISKSQNFHEIKSEISEYNNVYNSISMHIYSLPSYTINSYKNFLLKGKKKIELRMTLFKNTSFMSS